MEVCIFWVNRRVFILVTFSSSEHNFLSPFPDSLITTVFVLVLVYHSVYQADKTSIPDAAIPHVAVECFCVCHSFPFPCEDFHCLLCTSWWVAFSTSKSTQIENEQQPSQPQTRSRSTVGEQTTIWDIAGITDPCNDTTLPSNCLCLSGLLHEWGKSWRIS